MVHDADSCMREDFGVALDVMNGAIREIVSESAHCAYPLSDMVVALICSVHQITGARLSPAELAAIGERANTIIDAVEDAEDFEAEAADGLADIPVADVPPRVILTRGDVTMIAEKVAELLGQKAGQHG